MTLEPCLSCLKLVMSAGIREVYYETPFMGTASAQVRDLFIQEELIQIKQIHLSKEIAEKASLSLLKPTSVLERDIRQQINL